ncbi:hypothetical protein M413DRAFT_165529 [Hebeloma cylindrosporum]|uniref:Uncharacterized protein n=1 Tax=Hebeloma cylindrosporum TaxID=76867 RepID=A0A0C3CAM8_HEBCY|nr:hypothetical protein M413DRAFT_165529 [Hebeloma cylindrosporum h7]
MLTGMRARYEDHHVPDMDSTVTRQSWFNFGPGTCVRRTVTGLIAYGYGMLAILDISERAIDIRWTGFTYPGPRGSGGMSISTCGSAAGTQGWQRVNTTIVHESVLLA